MEMDRDNMDPTTLKLMKAMRDLHRFSGHDFSIGNCKASEVRILFCIRYGMMSVSEISKMLHVTSPSVTQLLKGLEAHELIERHIDPADRRVVVIKLTEQGEKIVKMAMEGAKRNLDGLVAYLGREDCERFVELTEKVMRYFSEQRQATFARQTQWNEEEQL